MSAPGVPRAVLPEPALGAAVPPEADGYSRLDLRPAELLVLHTTTAMPTSTEFEAAQALQRATRLPVIMLGPTDRVSALTEADLARVGLGRVT